jgi:hypothetical protein
VTSHNATTYAPQAPLMRAASPYLVLPPVSGMREPGEAYTTVFGLAATPARGASNPRTAGKRTTKR